MPPLLESVLRPSLLAGRAVAAPDPWAGPLRALGARVVAPPPAVAGDDAEPFLAWAQAADAIDVVVAAPARGAALEQAADALWLTVRAAANAHWVDRGRDGAVLLVAPRPGDGGDAAPLRAALENLARTLSIEWARHAIRTTAVLPGDATTEDEVATTLAFLASPAAAYWSGCVVELGAAGSRAARSQP